MRLRQAAPLLFLVLLPAAGGGLAAQEDRSEAQSGPSDAGHAFESPGGFEPAPYEAPEPPAMPHSEPSSEGPSDTSTSMSGRYAVPVTELPEPHRQRPPSRPSVEPPPSGGGDDEVYDVPEPSGGSYTPHGVVEGELESHASGRDPGRPFLGALDLDLRPGRTQVYLDGQYMGTVDQFDGWPAFLVLPEGEYELVFYLDGFRTLTRQVRIDPGTVIKMNDRLERGPSIHPEDLVSGEPYEGGTSGGR